MAKLVYATILSLDGYTTNKDGNFDWAMPGLEVITCANDIERRCRTSLYGRRMYETMVYWETNGDADNNEYGDSSCHSGRPSAPGRQTPPQDPKAPQQDEAD